MKKLISKSLADSIYDILEEVCGATDTGRDQFVLWAAGKDEVSPEYRFGGIFGMAGKMWLTEDGFRVSGPNSEELKQYTYPERLEERLIITNERISLLKD